MRWLLLAQADQGDTDWGYWVIRAALIVGALIVVVVTSSLCRRAIRRARGVMADATTEDQVRAARRQVAITSALTYVIRVGAWVAFLVLALSLVRVNVAALVAGAGIVGAGLAFGAQNVVKDYLAGFYVVAEDQYAVGDTVELGMVSGGRATVTGVVEDLDFRRTAIRQFDGSLVSVGNGSIILAENRSRGTGPLVLRIAVRSTGTLEDARQALGDLVEELRRDPAVATLVTDGPTAVGVEPTAGPGNLVILTAEVPASSRRAAEELIRDRINARFVPLSWIDGTGSDEHPGV